MEIMLQASENDNPTRDLMGRQSSGGSTGTIVLPVGAIVGVALVGSAILFVALTVAIMHYLRSRYPSKNGARDLDLCEDNEEEILDDLRSSRPSELGLVTKLPHRASDAGAESLPKEWTEIPLYGPLLDKSRLMRPAYAFEISGLRDAWPLVGWGESPATVLASKHSIVNLGHTDRRASYSVFPLSMDNEPSWPQPTLSRASSCTRGLDGKPIRWSGHSAKSSTISLRRLSSAQKSVSDNQLTAILRSTSQRLKEAQRRPLSRSLSVMSQVPGAPPTAQPPSPPVDKPRESRKESNETDHTSLIDSVRSSVLDSTSQTPIQRKLRSPRAGEVEGNERKVSPVNSEISESDSLCPPQTPDFFIPDALGAPSTKLSKDLNPSPLLGGVARTICNSFSSDRNEFASDPFVFTDLRTKLARETKSIKGPRPLFKPQVVAEPRSNSKPQGTLLSPLRVVSGNQKLLNKPGIAPKDLSAASQENPFQWSPQLSPLLLPPAGQKPTGIRPKGHRRRRTVRLSRLDPPANVTVFVEEPLNGSSPELMDESICQKLPTILPAELVDTSIDGIVPRSRLPSIPKFQPFLPVPSTGALADSTLSSDGSYSATMSFYDYYSAGSAFSSDHLRVPERVKSPSPSTKRSRRKGRNFSINITPIRDIAPSKATASSLHANNSPPFLHSALRQLSNTDISHDAPVIPAFKSSSHGLASPPAAINESITASVSLLRRMNSEVSTYSTGSFLSDYSNGSPTLPELRGGGLSPTKRGNKGTMNYLGIGVETISPTARRGKAQTSGVTRKSRDYHRGVVLEEGRQNYDALGLVLPILEDPTPKLPSLDPQMNESSQTNWHPTPLNWPSTSPKFPSPPRRTKAPVAQLRPVSSTPLSQENCHSCSKPLSPLRLNPRDNTLSSRYHDRCFKCSTCNEPLGTAFTIDKKPYCKQHYYEKVNEICDFDESLNKKLAHDQKDARWSDVMTTPLKRGVRHESQLDMPFPHGCSPKSTINWRGSLGLYDEMGFLKSSPDRGDDASSFGLGP